MSLESNPSTQNKVQTADIMSGFTDIVSNFAEIVANMKIEIEMDIKNEAREKAEAAAAAAENNDEWVSTTSESDVTDNTMTALTESVSMMESAKHEVKVARAAVDAANDAIERSMTGMNIAIDKVAKVLDNVVMDVKIKEMLDRKIKEVMDDWVVVIHEKTLAKMYAELILDQVNSNNALK